MCTQITIVSVIFCVENNLFFPIFSLSTLKIFHFLFKYNYKPKLTHNISLDLTQ